MEDGNIYAGIDFISDSIIHRLTCGLDKQMRMLELIDVLFCPYFIAYFYRGGNWMESLRLRAPRNGGVILGSLILYSIF